MTAVPAIQLIEIDQHNWRAVARIRPRPDQEAWVASTTYYMCLSHFGGEWRCLAAEDAGTIVGHVMWGLEGDEAWIGGLIVDALHQGRGIGRAIVDRLLERFSDLPGVRRAALSFAPENVVARHLYRSLGFVETGEMEDDEIVAKRTLP